MKIIYTETALKELDAFLEKSQENLERQVAREKSVFGDDLVEITANDIQKTYKRGFYNSYLERRSYRLKFISLTYILFGVLTAVGALAYQPLKSLFAENQLQFALFVFGIFMTIAGLFVRYIQSFKDKELYNQDRESLMLSDTSSIGEIYLEKEYVTDLSSSE